MHSFLSICISLFLKAKCTINQQSIGYGNGWAWNRWQAITATSIAPVHIRIYMCVTRFQWNNGKSENVDIRNYPSWHGKLKCQWLLDTAIRMNATCKVHSTHWDMDKMATILQTEFQMHCYESKYEYLDHNCPETCFWRAINYMSALFYKWIGV